MSVVVYMSLSTFASNGKILGNNRTIEPILKSKQNNVITQKVEKIAFLFRIIQLV